MPLPKSSLQEKILNRREENNNENPSSLLPSPSPNIIEQQQQKDDERVLCRIRVYCKYEHLLTPQEREYYGPYTIHDCLRLSSLPPKLQQQSKQRNINIPIGLWKSFWMDINKVIKEYESRATIVCMQVLFLFLLYYVLHVRLINLHIQYQDEREANGTATTGTFVNLTLSTILNAVVIIGACVFMYHIYYKGSREVEEMILKLNLICNDYTYDYSMRNNNGSGGFQSTCNCIVSFQQYHLGYRFDTRLWRSRDRSRKDEPLEVKVGIIIITKATTTTAAKATTTSSSSLVPSSLPLPLPLSPAPRRTLDNNKEEETGTGSSSNHDHAGNVAVV